MGFLEEQMCIGSILTRFCLENAEPYSLAVGKWVVGSQLSLREIIGTFKKKKKKTFGSPAV